MIEALCWNLMIIVDLVIAWLVISWVGDWRRTAQRITADIAFLKAVQRSQDEADASLMNPWDERPA